MRDTDADWRAISEAEPYFGVLSGPQFLLANFSSEARATFYSTGDAEVAHYLSTIKDKVLAAFAPRYAMDLGCGVGRLTLAIARPGESWLIRITIA